MGSTSIRWLPLLCTWCLQVSHSIAGPQNPFNPQLGSDFDMEIYDYGPEHGGDIETMIKVLDDIIVSMSECVRSPKVFKAFQLRC